MKLPDGSSVLIVLMGSIGDVARGLALVQQLRSQVKDVRITWIVEPKSRDVAALHNGIDELLVFERGRGVRALLELRKTLRARRFDVALDLQRIFKSGLITWLSGAPRRIGFHRGDSKEFNYLFCNEQIPPLGDKISKLDHYLAFIGQLGLPLTQPIEFGIRNAALAQTLPAQFSNETKNRFVVVLGSAWQSKNWSDAGYDELLKYLLTQTHAQIVLAGDGSKADLALRLQAANPDIRVVSAAGTTTLVQLAGILARADAACGPDSGPGHIAAAVGTPYVTLFGPTDPVRTAPFGCEDLVVHSAVGCAPCYRKECPGLNRLCMRLISPATVFERLLAAAQL